jgi:hypothetical protein
VQILPPNLARFLKCSFPSKFNKKGKPIDESSLFRPWCLHVINRLVAYHSSLSPPQWDEGREGPPSNDRHISFHLHHLEGNGLPLTIEEARLLQSMKLLSFQVIPSSSSSSQDDASNPIMTAATAMAVEPLRIWMTDMLDQKVYWHSISPHGLSFQLTLTGGFVMIVR